MANERRLIDAVALEARLCEIHQKIAAETLVLDMLNGIPAGLGPFGCAVTTR